MSKREWTLFVEDILESVGLIEEYVKDMEFNDFQQDRKTIDAVVRNFTIIGEASKYIPDNIKVQFTQVDWKGIQGFRNRIAHEYFGLSLSIVWDIIIKELPMLKIQMQEIWEKERK